MHTAIYGPWRPRPVDVMEGGVFWLKIGLMLFTAIIIPLRIPRPVDAKVGINFSDSRLLIQMDPSGTHDPCE